MKKKEKQIKLEREILGLTQKLKEFTIEEDKMSRSTIFSLELYLVLLENAISEVSSKLNLCKEQIKG